jgi:hypothetical protein
MSERYKANHPTAFAGSAKLFQIMQIPTFLKKQEQLATKTQITSHFTSKSN